MHGIAETSHENLGNLVLKLLNEKLYVSITENEIDKSHRIGRKRMDRDQDKLLLNSEI